MRIVRLNIIFSAILLSCSMSSYSANTINFTGKITEDTCSHQNTHTDCQSLNDIHKKIDNFTVSAKDLTLKFENNDIANYQVELRQKSHAVLTASYH